MAAERSGLITNIATIQGQVKVALDHVFKNFESDVNQQIRAALDDVLLGLLFPNAPDPKGMFSRLCSRGFYDSPNRPENFARFCATVACDRTPPQDETNDILAWSSRCEVDTGWPMLERSGERLLTAL